MTRWSAVDPMSEFMPHVLHIGGSVMSGQAIRDVLRASTGQRFDLEWSAR